MNINTYLSGKTGSGSDLETLSSTEVDGGDEGAEEHLKARDLLDHVVVIVMLLLLLME